MVVFAGRVEEDAKNDLARARCDLQSAKKIIVHDQYIKETDVSAYFYACDAILIDYPKCFKVSSGGFTRCLAAGRVPIVPRHGINAEVVCEMGVGLVYDTECAKSLSIEMINLSDYVVNKERLYSECRKRCLEVYTYFIAEE